MRYDAFISYSHAADGPMAAAIQRGLQRLLRRPPSLWAKRAFRDATDVVPSSPLKSELLSKLDQSEWLILLASPEAASSEWVAAEIQHWVLLGRTDRIIIAVTSGEFGWDQSSRDFDGRLSSAIPATLHGVFDAEPAMVDLRSVDAMDESVWRHGSFREALIQIAAPIHGKAPAEIDSEELQRHRQRQALRRWSVGAVVGIVVLSTIALQVVGDDLGVFRVQYAFSTERATEVFAEIRSSGSQRQLGLWLGIAPISEIAVGLMLANWAFRLGQSLEGMGHRTIMSTVSRPAMYIAALGGLLGALSVGGLIVMAVDQVETAFLTLTGMLAITRWMIVVSVFAYCFVAAQVFMSQVRQRERE